MTLVAAFRTMKYGILLCADREERWGDAKLEIEKIHHTFIDPCEIFIAGAGRTGIITNARDGIFGSLREDTKHGKDVIRGHKARIESVLKSIYKRYVQTPDDVIDLLIVIAPHAIGSLPLLYKTESTMLIPVAEYAAFGSGKEISDYLSARLYDADHANDTLVLLAALICREAEYKAGGVGLGFDMAFIHDGDNDTVRCLGKDSIRELQAGIPSLKDAVFSHWKGQVGIPERLRDHVFGPKNI